MTYFDLPIDDKPRSTNLIRAIDRAYEIRDMLAEGELCLVKNTKPLGRGTMFLRIGGYNVTEERLAQLKELVA